jgi:hypothetical protein
MKEILDNTDLVQLVLESATQYQRLVKDTLDMEEKSLGDATIMSGSLTHKDCIERYFKVISFLLLKYDSYCQIKKDQVDLMYLIFVDQAVGQTESERFFHFFTFDEFDWSQESKKNMIKGKIREHLFRSVLGQDETIKTCSMQAF